MNPRERLLAVLEGRRPDRVPLVMEGFHEPPWTPVEDPGKGMLRDRVGDELHYFVGFPSHSNRFLVTPSQRIRVVDRREQRNGDIVTRREIDTPGGPLSSVTGRNELSHTTWTIRYPVESLADIERIRSVPWERPKGLKAPDLSILPDSFAEKGITLTRIPSPVVCVAGMMSYEFFLELCLTDFQLVKELTEQCLGRILKLLDVMLCDRSIEYVWMGGCEWLTPPMASPALYDALVQPYEQVLIERIHAAEAFSHVHCHGNVRSTLERVIERGADFFEPVEPPPDGDITFAEAKGRARGRIALGGNIEARILDNEDADVVEEAVRQAFEGGADRMVLQTSAGPLCRMTPRMVDNYRRMIDVWEELSPVA